MSSGKRTMSSSRPLTLSVPVKWMPSLLRIKILKGFIPWKEQIIRTGLFSRIFREGALTLNRFGLILYCNTRLADMVKVSTENVLGTSISITSVLSTIGDTESVDRYPDKRIEYSGPDQAGFFFSPRFLFL